MDGVVGGEFKPGDIIVPIGDPDKYVVVAVDFCSPFPGSPMFYEYKITPWPPSGSVESNLKLPGFEADCNCVKVDSMDGEKVEEDDE